MLQLVLRGLHPYGGSAYNLNTAAQKFLITCFAYDRPCSGLEVAKTIAAVVFPFIDRNHHAILRLY